MQPVLMREELGGSINHAIMEVCRRDTGGQPGGAPDVLLFLMTVSAKDTFSLVTNHP